MSPVGYVDDNGDCDDEKASISPNALEICGNEIDENCNGLIDNSDVNPIHVDWYLDEDGDGYGSDVFLGNACFMDGASNNLDCDDEDASISPNASDDPYDGLDSDCDGSNDYDADQDGFIAAPEITGLEEDENEAYDCDDENIDVFPNAMEVCASDLDNNCNGTIDDCDGNIALEGSEDALYEGSALLSLHEDVLVVGAVGNNMPNIAMGQITIFGSVLDENTLSTTQTSLVGLNPSDLLGDKIFSAGDVNNDGIDDFGWVFIDQISMEQILERRLYGLSPFCWGFELG